MKTIQLILCGLLILLSLMQPCYAVVSKLALVVGNSDYQEAPLENPVNDARGMAKALTNLGFEVILKENQGKQDMDKAVREFGDRLGEGMVGLFYFAGHGMQVKGKNYLIPVRSGIKREDEVPYNAFDVNQLLAKMDSAHNSLNLVILDACRNNPFERSFRSVTEGLASMDAPSGTLIVFAAKPGMKSKDSDTGGHNGLYTGILLKYMTTMPNLPIGELLIKVRAEVNRISGGEQYPWEEGGLVKNFCFADCNAQPAAMPMEVVFWQSIKDSNNPADFQAYLDKYPNGQFAALARNRLTPVVPVAQPAPYTPPVPAPYIPPARTCSDCPEMVAIPGGEFYMGSDGSEPDAGAHEKPRHLVLVAAFSLGKYEVTQSQWQAVMGTNPSHFSQCGGSCPVEQVSYNDAQAFVARLNTKTGQHYRLPTEAEWEYACRAGGAETYCGSNTIDAVAWYHGNSGNKTHPVGQKQANAFGLYDMSGNVWEWTCSAYSEQGYDGGEKICNNNTNYSRAHRGGSWTNNPPALRSAYRYGDAPAYRVNLLGFRLAQDN